MTDEFDPCVTRGPQNSGVKLPGGQAQGQLRRSCISRSTQKFHGPIESARGLSLISDSSLHLGLQVCDSPLLLLQSPG